MSSHHFSSENNPDGLEDGVDDHDHISDKLCHLGQRRRFWRPTVKFLLGKSRGSSVLTGLMFFIFLTWAISKRLSLRGFLAPLFLLVIMEVATDIADKHITAVVTMNLTIPEILYHLSIATLMAMLEIYLWSSVIKVYQTCNCSRKKKDS